MSVTRREQLRALLVHKDQPGASQVHVDTPTWTAPKKKPRRQVLRDAVTAVAVAKLGDVSAGLVADPGLYVGRMVQNAQQLRDWWATTRGTDEPQQLDADTHCTVLYSRTAVTAPPDASHVVIQPEQTRFGMLGRDNAVVLFLDAPVLVGRNQQLHAAGAVEDYPSHQPHITLFYLGADYDSMDWRDGNHPAAPPFPIVLGPELSGPLGTDVYQAAQLPSWYVGGAGARP